MTESEFVVTCQRLGSTFHPFAEYMKEQIKSSLFTSDDDESIKVARIKYKFLEELSTIITNNKEGNS